MRKAITKIVILLALFPLSGISQGLTFRTLPHIKGADPDSENGLSVNRAGVMLLDFIVAATGQHKAVKLYPTGYVSVTAPAHVFYPIDFNSVGQLGGLLSFGNDTFGFVTNRDGITSTYSAGPSYRITGGGTINDLSDKVITIRSRATGDTSGAVKDHLGRLTKLDYPGAAWTDALGINNDGNVVGSWNDNATDHGYFWSQGKFYLLDVPGSVATYPNAIGNDGSIVGLFVDGNDPTTHGFVFRFLSINANDTLDGQFTTVDFPAPGIFLTNVNSISPDGSTIIGTYLVANPAIVNGLERFAYVAKFN